jgi:hypothetical protein
MDTRIASRYDYYYFGSVYTSFRRHGSNMGNLEYMRDDFLTADMLKKRKAWGYLSPEGRHQLGVHDLDRFLAQDAAQTALTGAIVMIAYGRPGLSWFYMRQALKLDGRTWRRSRFWQALILTLIPRLGTSIMARRMKMNTVDDTAAQAVEASLNAIH